MHFHLKQPNCSWTFHSLAKAKFFLSSTQLRTTLLRVKMGLDEKNLKCQEPGGISFFPLYAKLRQRLGHECEYESQKNFPLSSLFFCNHDICNMSKDVAFYVLLTLKPPRSLSLWLTLVCSLLYKLAQTKTHTRTRTHTHAQSVLWHQPFIVLIKSRQMSQAIKVSQVLD